MKNLIFTLVALISISTVIAQKKYLTKAGFLALDASVPSFEEVAAKNNSVTAIINTESGAFAALVLVKGFRFKNALMEEHFNENYAESDRYPKSTFKGKIENFDFDSLSEIDSSMSIDGSVSFHGVTKAINNSPIIIKMVDDKIVLSGSFNVSVSDFDIEIPKIVKNQLSNEVSVVFNFELVKK